MGLIRLSLEEGDGHFVFNQTFILDLCLHIVGGGSWLGGEVKNPMPLKHGVLGKSGTVI